VGALLQLVEPSHLRFRALVAPADDPIFAERVGVALEAALANGRDPEVDLAERQLRTTYPRAQLRRRDSVADIGGEAPVVYAYRDGAALAAVGGDTWWTALGVARVVISAGRYVEANPASAELFGRPRDDLLGRVAGELTVADSRVDRAWLWEQLQRAGRLQSISRIELPAGQPVRVEFVTLLDGDGPGRHETFLRELAPA
jgi:PAS domain-containing protein